MTAWSQLPYPVGETYLRTFIWCELVSNTAHLAHCGALIIVSLFTYTWKLARTMLAGSQLKVYY